EILREFGYSEEDDELCARLLDSILTDRDVKKLLERLERKIRNKDVVVFGAGPSLTEKLKRYKSLLSKCTLIAADGATTALLENDVFPDIVVTDLDGKMDDILKVDRAGEIILVHAHGDNIEKVKKYGNEIKNMVGTTQTDPKKFKNLMNFGGFTDGDRAVFLAEHFGAKNIYLIGFDFDGRIGKYSFTRNKEIKIKKLEWCKRLLDIIENVIFL
ncbi:MAG TPA: DUF115 domain-containing protein, partial [Thermoplasmatales archaeon]|nr:DUF115 domain-containing protein [Thermoplasmatales archaeon]